MRKINYYTRSGRYLKKSKKKMGAMSTQTMSFPQLRLLKKKLYEIEISCYLYPFFDKNIPFQYFHLKFQYFHPEKKIKFNMIY